MKKPMLALTVLVGIVLGLGATTVITGAATGNSKAAPPRTDGRSAEIVIAWNQELLHIVQTPCAQPATVHPTRSYAILHAAIYDSVVSITKDDPAYLLSVRAPRSAR